MTNSLKLFFKLLSLITLLLLFIVMLFVAAYYPELSVSLMIGISFYFFCVLVRLLSFKSSPPYLSVITSATLLALLLLYLFKPLFDEYIEYVTLFFEAFLVTALWMVFLLKGKIYSYFVKNGKMKNLQLSIRYNEFFRITSLCKNILTLHLLIVGVYYFYLPAYHTFETSKFLFSQLNLCLVFTISIYEYIRVFMLYKEIDAESWLPIVNESGSVIGKMTLSMALATQKQFLFPVVRIALVCENMLYLTRRDENTIVESDKIDTPFEKYVNYDQTLKGAVKHILNNKVGLHDVNAKFVFKYIFKDPSTHRLTYLYVAQISSLQHARNVNLAEGKWWYEKQIEENLNKGLFSEFFEKEYEILKNTILLAAHLSKQSFEGNKL